MKWMQQNIECSNNWCQSPWHSQDLSEMQCENRAVHLNTGKMHKVGVCNVAKVQHLYRSTICKDALHGRLYTGKVVRDLAEVADDTAVTEEGLMKLAPLSSVTYNDINVIMAFSK